MISFKPVNGKWRGVPDGQVVTLQCSCGCKEFAIIPVALVTVDRLNPRDFQLTKGEKLQCLKCGAFMGFNEATQTWRAVHLTAEA